MVTLVKFVVFALVYVFARRTIRLELEASATGTSVTRRSLVTDLRASVVLRATTCVYFTTPFVSSVDTILATITDFTPWKTSPVTAAKRSRGTRGRHGCLAQHQVFVRIVRTISVAITHVVTGNAETILASKLVFITGVISAMLLVRVVTAVILAIA